MPKNGPPQPNYNINTSNENENESEKQITIDIYCGGRSKKRAEMEKSCKISLFLAFKNPETFI